MTPSIAMLFGHARPFLPPVGAARLVTFERQAAEVETLDDIPEERITLAARILAALAEGPATQADLVGRLKHYSGDEISGALVSLVSRGRVAKVGVRRVGRHDVTVFALAGGVA